MFAPCPPDLCGVNMCQPFSVCKIMVPLLLYYHSCITSASLLLLGWEGRRLKTLFLRKDIVTKSEFGIWLVLRCTLACFTTSIVCVWDGFRSNLCESFLNRSCHQVNLTCCCDQRLKAVRSARTIQTPLPGSLDSEVNMDLMMKWGEHLHFQHQPIVQS